MVEYDDAGNLIQTENGYELVYDCENRHVHDVDGTRHREHMIGDRTIVPAPE